MVTNKIRLDFLYYLSTIVTIFSVLILSFCTDGYYLVVLIPLYSYGVKEVQKVQRLTGPGAEYSDVPGVTAGGGKWPERWVT